MCRSLTVSSDALILLPRDSGGGGNDSKGLAAPGRDIPREAQWSHELRMTPS